MSPLLSLITVTWNHRDEIGEYIDAIAEARARADFEIELVIVDNASSDDTAAFVGERAPWARVVANRENVGFADGCSIGLAAATGEYLMLLNPDAFVSAEALKGMLDYLKVNPKIGAIGCRLVHDDGLPQDSAYPPISAGAYLVYSSCLYPVFEGLKKVPAMLGIQPSQSPRECGWLMGSCIVVPRAAYEKVGGLDGSYFMYSEDADWCESIRKAGYTVVHHPGYTMRHRQKGSSRRAPEFTFRRLYRSMVHYANKHMVGAAHRRMMTVMMLDMTLRIPLYALIGMLKPARREALKARIESVRLLKEIIRRRDPNYMPDKRPGT